MRGLSRYAEYDTFPSRVRLLSPERTGANRLHNPCERLSRSRFRQQPARSGRCSASSWATRSEDCSSFRTTTDCHGRHIVTPMVARLSAALMRCRSRRDTAPIQSSQATFQDLARTLPTERGRRRCRHRRDSASAWAPTGARALRSATPVARRRQAQHSRRRPPPGRTGRAAHRLRVSSPASAASVKSGRISGGSRAQVLGATRSSS